MWAGVHSTAGPEMVHNQTALPTLDLAKQSLCPRLPSQGTSVLWSSFLKIF